MTTRSSVFTTGLDLPLAHHGVPLLVLARTMRGCVLGASVTLASPPGVCMAVTSSESAFHIRSIALRRLLRLQDCMAVSLTPQHV